MVFMRGRDSKPPAISLSLAGNSLLFISLFDLFHEVDFIIIYSYWERKLGSISEIGQDLCLGWKSVMDYVDLWYLLLH